MSPPEPDGPDSALSRLEARYQGRVARERSARQQAEKLLEDRSLELYRANQALKASASELECLVQARTQALQQALEAARAATQAKGRFLATMSHEIRTPMNAILGLAELLQHSPLNAEQAASVDTLRRSGESLLVLINDILDFSKIEAGQLTLEEVAMSPHDELLSVVDLLGPQAQAKGLELDLEIAPETPAWVLGDPTRLRQVWLNLVGNALKFTAQGGVSVVLMPSPDQPGWLRSEIEDTGVGISDAAQARIFDPFVQADSSTTREFGGTGLGLGISQRIVQSMGGHLWVESTPGVGSLFGFEWPAAEAERSEATDPVELRQWRHEPVAFAAMSGDPAMPADALARLRVLVAEDHPVNRQLVQAQLKALGVMDVVVVNDGAAALERLQMQSFEVVLMDMHMPGVDGLEATQRLRRLPLAHQPWVVALTASAFEEDRLACQQAGMDDFVAKPVSVSALRAALQRSGTGDPRAWLGA